MRLMASRIEDYAVIGDCRTAALVARDGSIDWFCTPRFDSGACFAALLGTPDNGRWKIAPASKVEHVRVARRYRPGTLVLETEFTTDAGSVRLVDAMAIDSPTPILLRQVEGVHGRLPMRMDLIIRFDYGGIVPWVRAADGGISAIGGPDMLQLRGDVETRGEDLTTVAEFEVAEGQRLGFALAWHPSAEEPPPGIEVAAAIDRAGRWWRNWSQGCTYDGEYREAVLRSLITLKALTYAPTGGIAAAVTTSLPEQLGGVRNWDYRFCWLRDATFTLLALLGAGFQEEARAWREWLLRAVAGRPENLQIMYGLAGERRLMEYEVPWLAGYEGSRPVRVGNAASQQFQLDVYGEVFDALYQARRAGLAPLGDVWQMAKTVVRYLETAWKEPDEGIWEVRGPRRHFTHSKVMAWVAFDRAIKAMEQFQYQGPADEWRAIRDQIHDEVCRRGYDPARNTFVQSYDSKELDASLLMVPMVGFLPADDPRMLGTVEAIARDLRRDGFIERYASGSAVDGLPAGEGAFLPCTFWLADNYALQGRTDEARRIFEHLLTIRNDVGLLAEEYDTGNKRLLGNLPQAFSHISLINTAYNLHHKILGPAEHRAL
jgi:GH15 family glucan-1,4-alpha-glucosidase